MFDDNQVLSHDIYAKKAEKSRRKKPDCLPLGWPRGIGFLPLQAVRFLRLGCIQGRKVTSRHLPSPDAHVIKNDTGEQRHKQRAAYHYEAHILSPLELPFLTLSPSQTRPGPSHPATTRPAPAMRRAARRRPRQCRLDQTSSPRLDRQSSAAPWQQLQPEQLRTGRDEACDFSSTGNAMDTI
jgi:hypothetical protein